MSTLLQEQLARRGDLPRLLLIGVDHRTAPLELRERVAYGEGDGRRLLERLCAAAEVDEAFLLTTCNRTEVYLVPGREPDAYRLGLQLVFSERAPEIEAEGRFYVKRDAEAARHLIEVACGLQSMILGEPEILGQVRRAAGHAEVAAASGVVLQRLLRSAAEAGGRARRETAIGAGAVSFGYAVVDLARNYFQSLADCTVLIAGAGETARQVARSLRERGVRRLWVTNRSPERTEELRALFPEARAVPFAERRQALAACDVIVASTAAAAPIFTREDLAAAVGAGRERPLIVADLGVPRNVEPAAAELDDLCLVDVDSLEELISSNLKRRRLEVPRVQETVERELQRFSAWYRGRSVEPLIAELQKKAEEIRRLELTDARHRFPPETHEHLERLTRSLVRKLLHHPSVRLRSTDPGDVDRLDLVRELFELRGDGE